MSSICFHNMVKFGLLMVEICCRVWGTPANFNGFCVLASLLHRCCSTEVSQTLNDVWPSPALVYHTYVFRGSCPLTEFSSCRIHFASKSYFLLYWQHYCMALDHWYQPKFAAWCKEWKHGTFADGAAYIRQGGHHVRHWPTF